MQGHDDPKEAQRSLCEALNCVVRFVVRGGRCDLHLYLYMIEVAIIKIVLDEAPLVLEIDHHSNGPISLG
jgi:hypothetical protein